MCEMPNNWIQHIQKQLHLQIQNCVPKNTDECKIVHVLRNLYMYIYCVGKHRTHPNKFTVSNKQIHGKHLNA